MGLSSETILTIIKVLSMFLMFSLIMITGNLPLRWERFRKSNKLISLASAFSGGLFLAVGVLHLLPEAREAYDDYYEEKGLEPDEQFPWSNFICVVCFAFILFIEKVAFAAYVQEEGHGEHTHAHIPGIPTKRVHDHHSHGGSLVENPRDSLLKAQSKEHNQHISEEMNKEDVEEEIFQEKVNTTFRLAREARKSSIMSRIEKDHKLSKLTPYILQVAIGIHATFEGMAIGIETEIASCLGIALAVVCHKWAEGLTLGIAFFKAEVDLKMSTIMIAIQAIMNPIGIFIGWMLSDQGDLIRGIFESISAGTFLYIAAGEVIVNEFNLKRFRFFKFFLFCLAIGFVTSLFFIEQATGA